MLSRHSTNEVISPVQLTFDHTTTFTKRSRLYFDSPLPSTQTQHTTISQQIMSRPIPTPGPIRALRLPADGSPPHLLTLQTFIADPPERPPNTHLGYYRAMLEYLLDNDPVRHVPNVRVFWVPTAWELRDVVKVRYVSQAMPSLNGRYCLFMTDAKDGLRVNRYLSNDRFDYFGDAFVLKEVGYKWLPGADLNDVVACLAELRHEHVFPEYQNVPEDMVVGDLLEVIRRDCFRDDFKPEGPPVGVVYGVPVNPFLYPVVKKGC